MNLGMLTAEIQGVDRLKAVFGRTISDAVRAKLRTTIFKLAAEVQKHVKDEYLLGPKPIKLNVDTGRLRNSINIKPTETPTHIKATIGTNVFYGVAWELGNVKNWQGRVQAARPFLKPGFEDLRQHVHAQLKIAVSDVIKSGGFFASP